MRASVFVGKSESVNGHNTYVLGSLIIVGVILGSLFANIYCSENVGTQGVFNYDFIEKMQRMNIDNRELFNYIFVSRVKIWLILLFLSFSFLKHIIIYAYSLAAGFMAGLTCSDIVMTHGLNGVLIFAVVCLVSQILVYIGNIIMILTVINSQKQRMAKSGLHILAKMLPMLILSLFVILISAFLESAFNLMFISSFYRK